VASTNDDNVERFFSGDNGGLLSRRVMRRKQEVRGLASEELGPAGRLKVGSVARGVSRETAGTRLIRMNGQSSVPLASEGSLFFAVARIEGGAKRRVGDCRSSKKRKHVDGRDKPGHDETNRVSVRRPR
jgi:hypothetical protein